MLTYAVNTIDSLELVLEYLFILFLTCVRECTHIPVGEV